MERCVSMLLSGRRRCDSWVPWVPWVSWVRFGERNRDQLKGETPAHGGQRRWSDKRASREVGDEAA